MTDSGSRVFIGGPRPAQSDCKCDMHRLYGKLFRLRMQLRILSSVALDVPQCLILGALHTGLVSTVQRGSCRLGQDFRPD